MGIALMQLILVHIQNHFKYDIDYTPIISIYYILGRLTQSRNVLVAKHYICIKPTRMIITSITNKNEKYRYRKYAMYKELQFLR